MEPNLAEKAMQIIIAACYADSDKDMAGKQQQFDRAGVPTNL